MELQNLAEWKNADELLTSESLFVAIDIREYQSQPSRSAEQVYQELNHTTLQTLSPKVQDVLSQLVRKITFSSRNHLVFAITRVKNEAPIYGLSIDEKRLQIWALSVKPGARTFLINVEAAYKADAEKQHLFYWTGFQWPAHQPRMWMVMTIPTEDRSFVGKIGQNSGMILTETTPKECVQEPDGSIVMVDYPSQRGGMLYLANEPESDIYKKPGSGEDLFKVETLLLPNTN